VSKYLKKLFFNDKRLSECRLMAIVLFAIIIWQGNHYSDIFESQPVRLVPQYGSGPYFDTQKNSEANAEYMKTIFMGDVLNYLNFSPRTIVDQYQQFVVRLAPNLAAKTRYELISFAKKIAKDNRVFQRFYPSDVAFLTKNGRFFVSAKGQIEAFDGSVSQGKKSIVMVFEYVNIGGIPKIASIDKREIKKGESLLKVVGSMIGAKALVGKGVVEVIKEEKRDKEMQKAQKEAHLKKSREILGDE